MFGETYYQETPFTCELCKFSLYRVTPSRMVVCLTPTCTFDEPLFIVEAQP